MRKIIVAGLLLLLCAKTQAQDSDMQDSLRIINLDEVLLANKQTGAQQKLVNFYKRNDAATLEDILGRLPEVSLTRRGAYGMEPSIRSFNAGQINVLLDGMRIHGACTDKMDPVTIYIEPLNLASLELQTGAHGASSGSAIGGSINMKMTEPDFLHPQKITGAVSSGYQSAARSLYESLRLNYSNGRLALRGSATYRKSQNYRSGGGAKINFSQYEKLNYALSVKYLQGAHNALKADVILDDGWNIGYPALPMDVGKAAARIAALSFVHEDPAGLLQKLTVKAYANQVKHAMDDTRRPNVPMHMDMPGLSKTVGAFAEAAMQLNKKQSLQLRADGSSTYLQASMTMYQAGQLPMYMLTWPDNKKNQYGLSAAWTRETDSSFKIQLTTRIDYIHTYLNSEEAKDQVSIFGFADAAKENFLKNASVQVTKKLNPALKWSASFGYSERVPTASERYGFYLFNAGDGYDYIGNPALLPEKALQADVSVTYSRRKNRLQLSYFFSRVTDFIASEAAPGFSVMTIGANGVRTYTNLPNAIITGLEASAVLKPIPAMDFVSTLRYTYAKDNAGKALRGIAPLKNVSSLRYQAGRFFSQMETEIAAAQHRFDATAGEDETPPYILWHVRLGYQTKCFDRVVELQAGVENIFDKNYHEHLDWGNIARSGRNIYLQLKFAF